MKSVQELGSIIDKVTPLQEEKKIKQEAVIKALEKKKSDEQLVEYNGRVYKLRFTSPKPALNKKFIEKVIMLYNEEKSSVIPEDFIQYLINKQNEEKGDPKPRLSITKS
jgi:hypothetical protein